MANDVKKVVLLSRYTTLTCSGSNPSTFETAPLNVREFDSADITWWRGKATSGTPAFIARIQQSGNLVDWSDADQADITVNEDTEITGHYEFKMDWARVQIQINDGGGTPSVTCWGAGNFLPRRK